MRILHVVPCADEANGVYHVARMLAASQSADGCEATTVEAARFRTADCADCGEVWVHGMWLPRVWRACRKALGKRTGNGAGPSGGCKLVRMTHGSLSPVCLAKQGKWRKRLVSPVERWLFARTDRVVTTGAWETEWCRRWGLENEIQVVDLRQFFKLNAKGKTGNGIFWNDRPLHLLYLGRRHPLKGVEFLERAVREINGGMGRDSESGSKNGADATRPPALRLRPIELREVSDAQGGELEKVWEWCDVLCLPTLSENFGLVVAEALERGRPVVTTDGAPAWDPEKGNEAVAGITYLRGYREGTGEMRVKLLKDALMALVRQNGE